VACPFYIHEARNNALYHVAAAILAVKRTRHSWRTGRRPIGGRYGWTEDWKSSVQFWEFVPGTPIFVTRKVEGRKQEDG
jgi:hypothetical protein